MIDSYGGDFNNLLKQAVEAPTDCGGLLALPFLDDEPVSFGYGKNTREKAISSTFLAFICQPCCLDFVVVLK